MNKQKMVTQVHHVRYDPEIVVRIFKGEHWLLTNLNRRTKNISTGFIHCLLKWLEESIDKMVDLEMVEGDNREIYKNRLLQLIKDEIKRKEQENGKNKRVDGKSNN